MSDSTSGFTSMPAEPEYGLAEAQSRMQRQLMESTGVAESVFRPDTGQLLWNVRAYEIFGVSPIGSAVSPKMANELVYPDDLARLAQAREQLRKGPGAIEIDYRVIRPDGALVDVHTLMFSETDVQGRPVAHVEMSLDVTERRRVEAALIQSARLCRVLAQVSTDGYWEQSSAVPALAAHTPPESQALPAGGSPGPQRKMRVLYVEDNMYNLMLFDDVMRTRDDVEVRMAQNGSQGFEVAGSWLPDVLVLDGRLPDTHGIDLLHRMRSIAGLEATPAFMCSADTQPEHKVLAQQAGFAGYWTKPVDFDKVFDELDRIAGSADLS